jgi:hypothetical protein
MLSKIKIVIDSPTREVKGANNQLNFIVVESV